MPAPDRKRRLTAFAVAMAVLIATPLVVVASDAFTDVPDSNVHHGDITWLRDNGVTFGCNPPANTEFCPGDPVLRQQMASFMRRLAENQVVDAATALEADHAATADNADTLDGVDGTDYVQKAEANSVTSEMMTNEPGLAQATSSALVDLSATPTSVISADISVPAAGHVLVHATWEAWAVHSNGTADISQFDVSDTDGTFPEPANTRNFIVPSGESNGNHTVVSATQRAFPVASAGTHTFYLVGLETSGTVRADDMVITLMYVPTVYGAVENAVSSSGASSDAAD